MPRGHVSHPEAVSEALLTEEEQHQVARWLGEFIPPHRIPALVQARYDKRLSPGYAYPFQQRRKWRGVIDRYRQEWLIKLGEVPLAHKRYRLERLMRLVDAVDRQQEQGGVAGVRVEQRLLKILDRARLEMEEKPDTSTTYFFTSINQASDEELLQRRTELLKRIQDFRWPSVRRRAYVPLRLGDGCEAGPAAGGAPAEDDGGDDAVGDRPRDVPSHRRLGGAGVAGGAATPDEPADGGVSDARRLETSVAVHGGGARTATGGPEDADRDERPAGA